MHEPNRNRHGPEEKSTDSRWPSGVPTTIARPTLLLARMRREERDAPSPLRVHEPMAVARFPYRLLESSMPRCEVEAMQSPWLTRRSAPVQDGPARHEELEASRTKDGQHRVTKGFSPPPEISFESCRAHKEFRP